MSNKWTTKWKKAFIWLSGYLSIIAFAIVGGYAIVKSEDEELQKSSKYAFAVTLAFAAFDAFLFLFNTLGATSANWIGSSAFDFYNVLVVLARLFKVIVFAVCTAYVFFKTPDEGNAEKSADKKDTATEKNADEETDQEVASTSTSTDDFDDEYRMV